MPEACQSRSKTKAAYRFSDHPETHMDVLLEPRYEATQQRVAAEKMVPAVQDTTSLNYSTTRPRRAWGRVGRNRKGSAVCWCIDDGLQSEGTPLGLLDVHCWGMRRVRGC
jgi:hypothetical protein